MKPWGPKWSPGWLVQKTFWLFMPAVLILASTVVLSAILEAQNWKDPLVIIKGSLYVVIPLFVTFIVILFFAFVCDVYLPDRFCWWKDKKTGKAERFGA